MIQKILANKVPLILSTVVVTMLMLFGVNVFVAIVMAILANGVLEFVNPKIGNPEYGGYGAVLTATMLHLL